MKRNRTKHVLASALALLVATAIQTSLPGCARSQQAQQDAATDATYTPERALERAIKRETRKPVALARQAPPPPGLDTTDLQPIPDDPTDEIQRARLPLDQTLERVETDFPSTPDLAPLQITDDERRRAIILYSRGRALRLDGRLEQAIATLEEAAKLDPDAASPWREIAEARLAMGDRHGARIAFSRAFDRDPAHPRILEQIALLPGADFSDREMAAILARLLSTRTAASDPALAYLVPARLGTALLNLGYATAAIQLLEQAVQLPERFGSPSNRGQELSSLYRRRGDIWTTIGDAHMRLQQFDQAIGAYDRAGDFPSLDPSGLLLRRVYAAMRLGRPATAAAFVLQRMDDSGARTDDALIETLRYAAQNSNISTDLDNALQALQASLPESERNLARGHLVLARAAVLPTDAAVRIYREHLEAYPSDELVLSGLFLSLAHESPDAALLEAVRLTDLEPLRNDRYVAALLRAVPDLPLLIDAWDTLDEQTRQSPAARLLQAQLLAAASRPMEADQALRSLLDDDPTYAPALIARVRLLEILERRREADQLLRSIDPGTDIDLAYVKARALLDRDDLAQARRVVNDALALETNEDDPRRAELFLLAARIAVRNANYESAERSYRQVLESDPAREEAHAGLIRLYASGAPLENDQKLVEQLALLRQANPSSRLLRTLRAREALARGQFDRAERELLELTEQFPDDEQSAEALIQLWLQINAHERAERWIARQIERFPARNTYHIFLARLYLDQRQEDEAVAVVEDWLERYPGDIEASTFLETLYEKIGDQQAANLLRLRRLENAGDSAATASRRAGIYIAMRDFSRITETIQQAVDHAVENKLDLTEWASDTVIVLYRLARRGACPALITANCQRIICENIDDLDSNAHLARLEILASVTIEFDAIREALARALIEHPDIAPDAYQVLVSFLISEQVLDSFHKPERADAARRARRPARTEELALRLENAAILLGEAAVLPNLTPEQHATFLALNYLTLGNAARSGALDDLEPAGDLADRLVQARNKDAIIDAAFRLTTNARETTRLPDPKIRSQYASNIATVLSNAGRDLGADAFDDLALRFDPNNQQSNNNYGYRLLDRNDANRLDEAVRMIERAYEASSNAIHVIDSLGWARYKAGVIHDVLDEQGNIVKSGAVSLLTRALRLAENSDEPLAFVNPPILANHLADALWAAGSREEAIARWREIPPLVDHALAQREAQFIGESVRRELASTRDAARQKLDAAIADRQPPVSPILRPVNRPDHIVPDDEPEPQPRTTPPPTPADNPG